MPPPGTRRSPDSDTCDTTRSLTTLPVNVDRPRQAARTGSSTEVGLPLLADERAGRRGNWEGRPLPAWRAVGRAGLRSEEQRSGRTRARGKTKELLVNNRAAIRIGPRCVAPPKPPRREEKASATTGHRQSRLPATRRLLSPKEEGPRAGPVQSRPPKRPGHGQDESRASLESDPLGLRRRDWRF
jgi:hypothetical protein